MAGEETRFQSSRIILSLTRSFDEAIKLGFRRWIIPEPFVSRARSPQGTQALGTRLCLQQFRPVAQYPGHESLQSIPGWESREKLIEAVFGFAGVNGERSFVSFYFWIVVFRAIQCCRALRPYLFRLPQKCWAAQPAFAFQKSVALQSSRGVIGRVLLRIDVVPLRWGRRIVDGGYTVCDEGLEPLIFVLYVSKYAGAVCPENRLLNCQVGLPSDHFIQPYRYHCCYQFQSWNRQGLQRCQSGFCH